MMHSFSEWIERSRPLLPLYRELATAYSYDFATHHIRMPLGRLSETARHLWKIAHESYFIACDLLSSALCLTGGPKTFRPSVEQCAALEQIDAGIPLAAYHQPYPTMAVEWPEGFARAHSFCGQSAERVIEEQWPVFSILHCEEEGKLRALWCATMFSGEVMSIQSIAPDVVTLAGALTSPAEATCGLTVEEDEAEVGRMMCRCAVNALFLLSHLGCASRGPTNSSFAERLERQIAGRRKRGQDAAALEDQRLTIPEWVDFASQVVLHSEGRIGDERDDTAAGPSGREPARPHWRRGHFRTQHYGVGLVNTRIVFIKPVLVNAHLLPAGALPAAHYRVAGNLA